MTIAKDNRAVSKSVLITVIIIVFALCVTAAFISVQYGPTASILPTATPTPTPTPTDTATLTPTPTPQTIQPTKVIMETTAGNIIIDLRTDKPITSTNFINLCNDGRYDGSTFHRVIETFMIQGGKVSSSVSPIQDEIGSNNHNTQYTIAMAKTSQPNSATSEFFINTVDNSRTKRYVGFDETYTVFGTVILGREVVDAIAKAPVTENPYMPGEISTPVNPIVILHTYVIPY